MEEKHDSAWKNLIQKYKNLLKEHQNVAFDDEVYKWETITYSVGKSWREILLYLLGKTESSKKASNLFYYSALSNAEVFLDDSRLDYVMNSLCSETEDLSIRLDKFKSNINELTSDLPKKYAKPDDERSASVFLTCHNPQKYTFYKPSYYEKLCNYLEVDQKSAGEKYSHYLSLIEDFENFVSADSEIMNFYNEHAKQYEKSTKLIVQNIIYTVFESGAKNAWLLTWNKENWDWKKYDDWCAGTKNGETYIENWTCKSKQPKIGDHVFLVKLGDEPRGIIAHGFVSKESYEATSYNNEKLTPHIDVEFDLIRNYKNEDILNIEILNSKMPNQKWIPQASGIEIKENYVKKLLELWNELIGDQKMSDTSNSLTERLKTLLLHTHNLILHGAPGTGKTHLAHEIAKSMNAETEFVQFHPSYDYTDFVEGLRPKNDDNGNIGFERKDGVFKKFCERALKNLTDSEKSVEDLQKEKDTDEQIEDFLDKAISSNQEFKLVNGSPFTITDNSEDRIFVNAPNTKKENLPIPKKDIFDILSQNMIINDVKDIRLIHSAKTRQQSDSYVFVLCKEIDKIKSQKQTKVVQNVQKIEKKKFLFIIDEINRGELSKIFGELFYAIDPGYRVKYEDLQKNRSGEKPLTTIRTQYANLETDGNEFDRALNINDADDFGHFFVPENVYIIGTMNDIDRSVDTMDFAFRRRFTFYEIKAEVTIEMLDEKTDENGNTTGLSAEIADEAKKRMTNLNYAIWHEPKNDKKEEEKSIMDSSSYHIGGAYFLKLNELDGDFDALWNYHLEGLLREYLRGRNDAEEKLDKLKNVYDMKNVVSINSTTANTQDATSQDSESVK